ncbi:MAG: Gfo/Idh/MocA family oxidoreductase [Syntrophobacteraceae bacterium]
MATDQPGIAVIGSGYWGRNLVRNYHQLGALRAVCDRNDSILGQMKEQYPGIDACLALNDLLSRKDIQGVIVATPAETHFNLAREILLAGKHLYVEKPLVLDEAEAQELIYLAAERRLTLMVGHLLQYHPAFVRLKEMVADGQLGRINYIYSHRLNLGKIRREENILWSFAPHDISMILSLAGESPESVLATGGNYLHSRIADVTTTHLEFPSGLRAHIFVSWLHPFKVQQLIVVGDRKMAVFDDTQPWKEKLLLYPHEINWCNHVPVPTRSEPEYVDIQPAEPLRLQCEHFLTCMVNGQEPVTDGWEALRVLRVLNAGQHSLNRNGARIRFGQSTATRSHGQTADAHEVQVRTVSDTKPGTDPQPYFVHETAVIDEGVSIGAGSKIWHFSHLLSGTRLGERCNVGQNVVIGPDVIIGNGCKIQNNVSVYKGVTLEEDVFCGPSMVFTNVFNPRAHIRRMEELRTTIVRKGATLGANCTVVCGVTIGRYAFAGAGSVVTTDIPDHALFAGNPARRIGWICACGEKLDPDLRCSACGTLYCKSTPGLAPAQPLNRQEQ